MSAYINRDISFNTLKCCMILFLAVANFLAVTSMHAQTEIFFDSFETGAFDLNHWEPVPGPNNGIVEVFLDSSTPDEFFAVRMGKSSDAGGVNTNELRLYLDLSGYDQVTLEFWIRDFADETGPFDAIYFSEDSAQTFVKVFQFDPGGWSNAWGKLPPLDIDGLAADNGLTLNHQFVISFRQMGTGDFNTAGDEDGIILDAVKVYDPGINYLSPPYSNGFESFEFDGIVTWAFPSYPSPGTTLPEYVRPGGLVQAFEDASAPEGNKAMQLGRRNDGNTTTNAIDFHFNLSAEEDVDLNFWIRDFADENHEEDGIFFSDNGGMTFTKIYDFLPEDWNNAWGTLPPLDVDRRAALNGLTLNEQFVIRFQQRGEGDFNTASIEDGLILDVVDLRDPQIAYVDSFPFHDGFESGELQKMWRQGDPYYPDTTAVDGRVRPGGLIGLSQSTPHGGFFHAIIGRRNDGASTTNALDLHLDLAGADTADLKFWIADFADESGPSDGLWFSNDGGVTFEKIYQFNPDSWTNNQYQEIVVDLDSAAAANNLELTGRCIVRFQQNGSGDFNTASIEDGFFIDDVTVTADIEVAISSYDEATASTDFMLSQNYPNPFNPATTIRYHLAKSARVDLKIYDQLGQLVQTLVSAEQPAGTYEVQWDGINQAGTRVASGIYFYRITTGAWQETRKMLLIQ